MTQYAYSPTTCEFIRTEAPADWMGRTDVAPPTFDPATAGCFWRGDHWEIVQGKAPDPTPNPLVAEAKVALERSDVTMLRCVEAGVSVPAEWSTYRKALRSIINGADTTSTVLPPIPAYPAGT